MNIQGTGYLPLSYRPMDLSTSRKEAPAFSDVASAVVTTQALTGQDDDIGLYDSAGKLVAAAAGFETAPPNGYELYMPVRPGYSSTNLALAVTDPSAEPFSSGLTKAQVAEAARKAIDARYAQMAEEGKPFDFNSFEGVDSYSAFGDLDRRALNAIHTDRSGLFSEREKAIAGSLMSQQQGLAMGLYAGPTRLKGTFDHSPAVLNPGPEAFMRLAKATVEWLDKLSHDEKTTSPIWVEQRAGNQWVYEHFATGLGLVPEDLGSGFPFVDMYLRALRELEELGVGHTLEDTRSYTKIWELFEQYQPDSATDPAAPDL